MLRHALCVPPLLCALAGACDARFAVHVEERAVPAFAGLAEGRGVELTADGAWCWFGEPRALRHRGRRDQTYVGYVSSAGEVAVTAVDHAARTQVTARLQQLYPDDHNSPALLLRPDGRLFAFYAEHDANRLAYRWTTRPEDLTAWSAERRIAVNVPGKLGQTYPNPVSLRDEGDRIFLFFRGARWDPLLSTSRDGRTWSPARVLLQSPWERPYVKYASDGRSRIHLAFTEGHPRDATNNKVLYAYYERGAFYRADGSLIRRLADLPLSIYEGDLVWGSPEQREPAWVWDIAAAPHGHAVIAFATVPSATAHRYHVAHWTGGAWRTSLVAEAGPSIVAGTAEPHYSGGIALDPQDPRRAYVSRVVQGVHELERFVTADEGASFSTTAITRGSTAPNLRPVVVRGHDGARLELLWMHGTYEHYYRRYRTRIVGAIAPAAGDPFPD